MNDIDFLKSIFIYDEIEGTLSWKRRDGVPEWWNTRYAGAKPKAVDALGYIRAKITYKEWSGYVSVHRVCFLLHNGYLPKIVDHIDGDVKNNKASNLRPVNDMTSAWNRKANSGTATGMKGVSVIKYTRGPSKGGICGYASSIGHNGKREYIGFFKTASEASDAYRAREIELRSDYVRNS